ncbi:hypothetical protein PMAYCL1PPCAC_15598, partial [Pristionchus mayeri]
MSVFMAILPAVQNFNSLPFFLSGCIVADKERVIVWNPKAHTIYRGLVVENGFIFREFETTGEIPNLTSGFAYCLYKGCLIIHGGLSFENPIEQISETFELNLEKLTWRKIETIATEVLSSSSHRLPRSFENVVVCGSRVYFMKDANRNFDITTMVSVLETNPSIFERSAPALSSFRVGRSIVEKAYPKSV